MEYTYEVTLDRVVKAMGGWELSIAIAKTQLRICLLILRKLHQPTTIEVLRVQFFILSVPAIMLVQLELLFCERKLRPGVFSLASYRISLAPCKTSPKAGVKTKSVVSIGESFKSGSGYSTLASYRT